MPGFALIHRARVVKSTRSGAKDELGERQAVPEYGPWFPCRRTTRRPSGKGTPDSGGTRRGERPWLLIWGDEDEDGAQLEAPTSTDRVEVEVPTATGTRRLLYIVDSVPADYDGGGGPFGGQAELVEVEQAAT